MGIEVGVIGVDASGGEVVSVVAGSVGPVVDGTAVVDDDGGGAGDVVVGSVVGGALVVVVGSLGPVCAPAWVAAANNPNVAINTPTIRHRPTSDRRALRTARCC
ncbi:MAG: hypothetical protein N2037_02375 [Acidimicrobiales bacterium]|nr:hypothetical protein [Acidimicrobiales bacterium]